MTYRFKPAELQHFNWMFNLAPCFPVSASKINIITEPSKFYDVLCERFCNAKHRISMASLYIGTGDLEKNLLKVTVEKVEVTKDLNFNVLLDYQRGTRGVVNSQTLFRQFVNGISNRCHLSLYQTPRLQGAWSKVLPSRYNEIVGLQHMKLYIADDSVILSGANCSNDYFNQRQDRYIEIKDGDLTNFYCEIIDEIVRYSKQDGKDSEIISKGKDVIVTELSQNIANIINRWKDRQTVKLSKLDKTVENDTWVFPLLQMGEFNIMQDEQATSRILSCVPRGSYLRLATGYFNLTENYAKILLKDCKASISLLMAHPNANGFMGAAGPAGGIPHAYSLIAQQFWQKVVDCNQSSRVQMLEYERKGWTFHAKGLWYYPPGSGVPWASVVGSANLGERSVRRDLEAQAAIFTSSLDLQNRLHNECSRLHDYASECSSELQERRTPLWVRATVGLFRTYF
ncbi:CDP-diacylglycerol--glycerol-3-phosphate 3-phosphatidyltransferase, mitochondrial [Maniola hyperantus]|uniref:CDP-diacylglycerol--glycerol-3-phosphate 3-phosphatidyltransferase, mitochondrial n=1 Tax=Aphantopus hyperantus TaxID=2795564 RepID=UPI00156853CD|nr:CDP-diacylglycerol--glycerol-3-phosphate 3-phosphatidyltransferase, mitochondrial [Maniola hyperantus]